MNLQSKFGNFITTESLIIALFIEAGRNYGQRRRTDDPITRCPVWTFHAGGIKIFQSRSNTNIKVTGSKVMVPCERICQKENTCEVLKSYLLTGTKIMI